MSHRYIAAWPILVGRAGVGESCHEDLFGQAVRDSEEVGADRRGGAGRRALAAIIATRLRGKHKPSYTPHSIAGTTSSSSMPRRSCSPAISDRTRSTTVTPATSAASRNGRPKHYLSGKTPQRVVEKAVQRMLPRGPLASTNSPICAFTPAPDHPHEAQQPEVLDIAAMNPKNTNYRKTKAANHGRGESAISPI